MKTEHIHHLTEKSLHSLVELLKAYETQISNIDVTKKTVVYYVKINLKDSLLTLDVILDNVYKILQLFTYPENSKYRIDLKYEVING